MPTDPDIYPTKSYAKNALVQPETRALFRRLLDQGWIDAIRTLHPDEPMYTFWDYKRNRWESDAGLRLDHLLLNAKAAKRLVDAGVDEGARRRERSRPRLDRAARYASHASEARSTFGEANPLEKPDKHASRSAVAPPTAAGHQQRFIRASLLSRSSEINPAARPQACRRHPWLCQHAASALPQRQPRAVLVAWDTLEAPTYRHEDFPAYQSGRKFDDALLEQLEVLPEFVTACGFQNAKAPGFEADDFLAAATAKEEKHGGAVFIASGDRDSFQLASDRTTILYPVRAGEMARLGPAEVRARYGVDPKQVPDFIALRGDPSDKVQGRPA